MMMRNSFTSKMRLWILSRMWKKNFVLHLPDSVLCKADCLGLCQKCGQNLNEGTCSCDNTVIDPRLAALKGFFTKQDD
ncbi:YceD family protein [Paenibacillus rhizoplanae]